MFWLSRPPYHRWLAAAALLVVAGLLDLSSRSTTPYPFTTRAVDAGEPVAGAVEWREAPRGLLGEPGDVEGLAAHPLAAGEPITLGAVGDDAGVPSGWWSIPVDLPESAARGMRVRLVATDPPLDAEGVVVEGPSQGAFAVTTPGLVAVPPDVTGAVAAASAVGSLMVLLGT